MTIQKQSTNLGGQIHLLRILYLLRLYLILCPLSVWENKSSLWGEADLQVSVANIDHFSVFSNIGNALKSDVMGDSHKCLFTEHSEPMTGQCADTTNIHLYKTMNFLTIVL